MSSPFQHTLMKKITALLACIMPALGLLAKGGGTAPDPKAGTNWLEMLLVFTAVILLVVIWGLGQVLLTLNRQLMEKRKNQGIVPAVLALIALLGLSGNVQAQAAPADGAVA